MKQHITRESAGIIVLNQDHTKILVVYPTNRFGNVLLTIPKGLLENGENALQAAQREFFEETGLPANFLRMLNNECPLLTFSKKYYNDLKQNIKSISIYFIADLEKPDDIIKEAKPPVSPELGFPETEKVEWLDIFKLLEIVPSKRNGQIVDAINEYLKAEDPRTY